MSPDPLDEVFTLEDQFYSRGYNQGFEDGAQAGRIEGRSLGMEKGFDKFCESGRLSARSVVWLNRLPAADTGNPAVATGGATSSASASRRHEPTAAAGSGGGGGSVGRKSVGAGCTLPPLPRNPRLERNIRMLYSLVEPDTFSVENTDEAVQDFDDRVKRAQGKAKIIERMISHR